MSGPSFYRYRRVHYSGYTHQLFPYRSLPAYLKGYSERRAVNDVDLAAIPLFVAARHLWWLAGQIKIAPTVGYSRLHSPGFFKRAVDFLEEWERSELVEYRM